MKDRIQYIDIAKGIGIILVVVGHVVSMDSWLKSYIYAFHMPLFFVLSGLVLSFGKRSFSQEMSHKFKALLVPYLIAGIIFSHLSIRLPLFIAYGSRESIAACGGVSSLWFLPVLFLSCLFSYYPLKFDRVLLSSAFFFIVGFCLPHLQPYGWPFGCDVAFVATGFVLLGFYSKRLNFQKIRRLPSLIVGCGVLICLYWLVFLNHPDTPGYVSMWKNSYGSKPLFLLTALLGTLGVLFVSRGVCVAGNLARWNVLSLIGRCSLWIFILHKVVLLRCGGISIWTEALIAIAVPMLLCLAWRMFMKKMSDRLSWICKLLYNTMLVPLVVMMPRDRHKIVFGAWSGRQFSCNPKYLMEYVLKRGGYKCVWIGGRHLRESVLKVPGARFAEKGSILAFWHCLTAKFYAFNVNQNDDISQIPRCNKVVLLYLTHGTPSKLTGSLQLNGGVVDNAPVIRTGLRSSLHKLVVKWDRYLSGQEAWFSATSSLGEKYRLSCMSFRLSADRLIRAGTPRFDFMINSADNAELRQKFRAQYARLLGIDPSKRWYIFVPTWRHDVKDTFSFSTSPRIKDYAKLLEDQNAIIIEKQHPKIFEESTIKGGFANNVCVVDREQSKNIDLQELLLACDRLITDYSSVYYDFYLINRPVIHFTYDYDHFMNKDMGFNFDIREYGGGPFAYIEDELLKYMAMDDAKLLSLRNEKTKEHLSYETGHACEGYYNLIERLSKK